MSARLTSEFWLHAYRTHLRLNDIPVFVLSKGDATAGAILIKQNPLNGQAILFQRSFDANGDRIWVILSEGAEADVDAVIAKQKSFDPDLWILEVEDREGRHLLYDPSLAN